MTVSHGLRSDVLISGPVKRDWSRRGLTAVAVAGRLCMGKDLLDPSAPVDSFAREIGCSLMPSPPTPSGQFS